MKNILIILSIFFSLDLTGQINYHQAPGQVTVVPNSVILPVSTITASSVTSNNPSSPAFNQTTPFSEQVNHIFQYVDRSPVSTGLLSDYGLEFEGVQKFNGTRTDSSYVSYDKWQMLYLSLYSFRFNDNQALVRPDLFYDNLKNFSNQSNGGANALNRLVHATSHAPVHHIVGLHLNYHKLRDDAISNNLVYVLNNQIFDTPGRAYSPYVVREAFAFTSNHQLLKGNDHQFVIRPELFITNTAKQIQSIQVDFGNGAGLLNVNFNTPVPISYGSAGTKVMVFKVNYTDGSSRESHSQVSVTGVSNTNPAARYTNGVNAMEIPFPRADFPAPQSYDGKVGEALVTVEFSSANAADRVIRRPLIIVESFDPDNSFEYEDLIEQTGPGGIDIPIAGQNLNNALETNGYDLIFIDFADGTDFLQRNAFVVRNVIEWVNSVKGLRNGVRESNVVVGFSMGGLIARYALRNMEMNGVNHETRLYASVDSPHQGANVPIGFQAMVSHLKGIPLGFGLPINIVFTDLGRFVPALNDAYNLLNSPAARQMLRYHVGGAGGILLHDNSMHESFMNEYRQMGYPQQNGIRNIVLANGSECGVDQGFANYAEFLNVNEEFVNFRWWADLASAYLSPIYLATNYSQLNLGSFLTTHNQVKGSFVVNALPDQSSARVYYGKLFVKRKILFVINADITLHENSFNSNPAYLALDNAPGGVYDIGVLAPDLPIDLAVTRFCFVPTFSALDISGGTQTITNADLRLKYSTASPPAAPKHVVAANFYSNPTELDVSNQIHTQLTNRSGNWLFQEIQNNPTVVNCAYMCGGSGASPISISGAEAVCNTNQVYMAANVPPGVAIAWTVSVNLTIVAGQGTTALTVAKSGAAGNGFVSVALSGICGNANPITKNLNVGVGYSSSNYPVTGPSSACTNSTLYYNTNDLPNATYYDWFWPSDWQYGGGQGTRYLTVNTTATSTSGAVGVRVHSACAQGGSPATQFTMVNNCGYYATFYPNPVSDELTVDMVVTDESQDLDEIPVVVTISDEQGNKKHEKDYKFGKHKPIKIKTDKLNTGIYILRFDTPQESQTHQIIVSHEN